MFHKYFKYTNSYRKKSMYTGVYLFFFPIISNSYAINNFYNIFVSLIKFIGVCRLFSLTVYAYEHMYFH